MAGLFKNGSHNRKPLRINPGHVATVGSGVERAKKD